MSDTTGKTAAAAAASSSLAMTEKRPQRPGGCVGIFFQLFDWNRSFAKKKLFSKKLLTPGRSKQSSSKFGGEEKLPKLRLIANENSGGFPKVKEDRTCTANNVQKSGMRSPGLVAKLMGLDSMPVAKQDKSGKGSLYVSGGDKEGCLSSHARSDDVCSSFEKGNTKGELRPQKLQKTGPSERRALSRFGAEALQFRSVLPRSRKHHPKLPAPVKSPRMTTGKNASRFMDAAAAKILKPGLQATNRSKFSLTYPSSMDHFPQNEVKMEETMGPLNISENCDYHVTTVKSFQGHSCKNCGSLVDVAESGPNLVEQPLPFASSVPNHINTLFLASETSKPGPMISSLGREKERVSDRIHEQPFPFSTQARINTCTRGKAICKRKPINLEDERWHWTYQQCKPRKGVPSSIDYRPNNQRQNQVRLTRERGTTRSNLSSLQTSRVLSAANAINNSKHFVAFNGNLRSAQSRMPVKVDNCKGNAEMKSCNRSGAGLSPVRKRRSTTVNQAGESSGFGSSTIARQRNVGGDVMTGKGMGLNTNSLNRTCRRSIMALEDPSKTISSKDSGVVSFMFSSPMKQKTMSGITHDKTPEISIKDKIDMKTSMEKSFALSGDALGALLENKLKELTSQEEDEFGTGGTRPKRTSAMILHELISALTADRPISHDDSVENESRCHADHFWNKKTKEKNTGASISYLRDGDHFSPGSVLEASFSNESCFSSSVDDSSVPAPNMDSDSMKHQFNEPEPLEPDAELLDSATSFTKGGYGHQLASDLLRQISDVSYSMCLAVTGLKGSKLVHAEEVISNAELMFRSSAPQNSDGTYVFSLSQFLLNELEALASGLWAEFGLFLLCFEDTKHGNQLKQFLFDCVIDYLDSRYVRYCNSGFRAWAGMSLSVTNDKLITGIVGEVRRWAQLAGKIPDEIIDTEMSHSLGKWTDFEIEMYETGAVIDVELLQILVDDIVLDLCEENMGFPGSCCAAAGDRWIDT